MQTLYLHAVVYAIFVFLASSQLSQIGCLPYFHKWCGLSANLRCWSETCCTWHAANTGCKKSSKNRHLGTIAQLCRSCYIFSIKAHIDNQKKLVKHQYLPHMPPQYGELRPTSGWDRSGSLGHPCKFQQVSRLGSLTACTRVLGISHTLRRWTEGATYIQQGGHQYKRWALAHISSCVLQLYAPAFAGTHCVGIARLGWPGGWLHDEMVPRPKTVTLTVLTMTDLQ